MGKHSVRAGSWKQAAAWAGLGLLTLLAGFVAVAYLAYSLPQAANLPCRNCSGDARLVHVNGFDLYYREAGDDLSRPPVVVVHGGPGHSSQSFKGAFDFLAKDHRVIYYDQRGSGNSQIKPDASLYTIDQLVDELETLRKDVIGSDRIILVGHSAGGALAQRYALAYPEHVEHLILVATIQINNGISARLAWDVFGPAFFVLGGGLPPADPLETNAWFARLMLSTSLPRMYDSGNASLIEDSGYISFATWREVSRSMEGPDFTDELSRLAVDTLVIYGTADSAYTGQANAERLCRLLPRCTLAGFEHSGHWPFLEEPQHFAQELTDYLGAAGSSGE